MLNEIKTLYLVQKQPGCPDPYIDVPLNSKLNNEVTVCDGSLQRTSLFFSLF